MLPDDSPFATILNKKPGAENTSGAQINKEAIPIFNIIRRIMPALLQNHRLQSQVISFKYAIGTITGSNQWP